MGRREEERMGEKRVEDYDKRKIETESVRERERKRERERERERENETPKGPIFCP